MRIPGARWLRRALGAMALGATVCIAASCATLHRDGVDWRQARRDTSRQAPDPARVRDAVVQVYAARTVGWRSALAVHTWIVVKRADAPAYRRFEVIGWGVDRGLPAIRIDRAGPDDHWFGARPALLADLRGDGVERVIDSVEAAVRSYPYPSSYRTWPGPNSNTFMAWIAREVPALRLDLPPTAIGKDYLPGTVFAWTPGGPGVQMSLLGVLGVLAGWEEGLELNLLGLTFGIDVKDPALKVPGLGRLGVSRIAGAPRVEAVETRDD